MSLLIEDSPRTHQAAWIIDAVRAGLGVGSVVSPFATPWARHSGPGKKPSVRDRAAKLRDSSVRVWFDPTTHALQMGGVGDYRYYDEYDLWSGPPGDLTTEAYREEHVRKVFEVQDELEAQHLAPTILLHSGLSDTSTRALDLAREAVRRDPQCWLSVAGTGPFWSSGHALDAHIGSLAALEPAGWFLTVVRTVTTVPVEAHPEDVHGLCRSTRALSDDGAPVHISHGDLAGLPAVAAGATSLGSGWDKRQRVCSYADYAERTTGTLGGSWYERPTLRQLLGSLSVNEARILTTRQPAYAERLGGVPAPGPKEAFMHHLRVLNEVTGQLLAFADHKQRYHALDSLYVAATAEWPEVERITNSEMAAQDWIAALSAGLRLYGATEGW